MRDYRETKEQNIQQPTEEKNHGEQMDKLKIIASQENWIDSLSAEALDHK